MDCLFLVFFIHSWTSEFLSESISLPPEELLFSILCREGPMLTDSLSFSYLTVRSLFHHHYCNRESSRLTVSFSQYSLSSGFRGFWWEIFGSSSDCSPIQSRLQDCSSVVRFPMTVTWQGVYLFEFILSGVYRTWICKVMSFTKFRKFLAIISLNIFSALDSLSFPSVIPVISRLLEIVPHFHEVPLIIFSLSLLFYFN